ncbi:MAG: hypothetical protein JO188_02190 [Hyphomicrobiales bacterium]|nr:hypothetical protein [Hyphomicrobiales bacterium]
MMTAGSVVNTGTLTLTGASSNDTKFNLTNVNTVGTLVASLGNVGSGSALSFTNADSYAIAGITADSVTLNENSSGATISQTAAINVSGSLTLNGAMAGNTNYDLNFATNSVGGTLTANLGTSAGGVGTGSLTYVDATPNGYTLGTITAANVMLQENASGDTITQSGAITATNLTLMGAASGDTQFTLTNTGNSVANIVGTLDSAFNFNPASSLSFTDNRNFAIGVAGQTNMNGTPLGIIAANVTLISSGTVTEVGNIFANSLSLFGSSTSDFELTGGAFAGNVVGTLTANLGSATGGTLNYASGSSFTLQNITAGSVTLSEMVTPVTISQATGTGISAASLTLNGAFSNDTQFALTGNNSVGMLTANLLPGGGSGTDSLSFTDASGNYKLGAITADTVVLNETAANATISQATSTDLHIGGLLLQGTGASYTIGSAASMIGALAANTGAVSVTANTITVGSVNRFVYSQSETLTVTPTGAATTTVTYDGATQTAASPGNFTFTGFVGGDGTNPNAVSGTAGVTRGTGRNVGTYAFTADVSGLTSDFGYQFQAGAPAGGLVITKAALTVSAVADTKVYDGTTASGGAVQVTGLQGSDTASFTQAFGSKNVLGQNGSTLSASGLVNDDNGGGNYAITFMNAAGTITKAALTVTEVSDSKVFDGTTGSTVSAQVSGLKGSDSVSGLGESFASANAGSQAMALGPLMVNDGNGGANYSLTVVNATGTITPAQLTITANNATQVIGTPEPVFSASFGPFPSGLGPSALSGMLSFTTNAPAGSPGSFQIFAGGVSSPNFDITFVPGTLLVTAANNSLPPVPFEMNQGNPAPVLSFTDPVLASLLVGGPAMKMNLSAPTLDENGNAIGSLISFDSTFIEVCRTRASCR